MDNFFLGLSYAVYKGVIRKGYKVPTPIQRKVRMIMMIVSLVSYLCHQSITTAWFGLVKFLQSQLV